MAQNFSRKKIAELCGFLENRWDFVCLLVSDLFLLIDNLELTQHSISSTPVQSRGQFIQIPPTKIQKSAQFSTPHPSKHFLPIISNHFLKLTLIDSLDCLVTPEMAGKARAKR
jgi:hypothetical protein